MSYFKGCSCIHVRCHACVFLLTGGLRPEHHANGENTIDSVHNKVKNGHEGDHEDLVPLGLILRPFKAVKWPDHHGRHVHHGRQHVGHRDQPLEGHREVREQLSDGQQDDEQGADEAQAVDCHAPLEAWRLRELLRVQGGEDDAGHKGLQDLQETRHGGQEAADLPAGPQAGHHHLATVYEETEP